MTSELERRVDDLAAKVAALEADAQGTYLAMRRAAFDAHCRSLRVESGAMDAICHLARTLVGKGLIDGAQLEQDMAERVRIFEAAGCSDRVFAAARLAGDIKAYREDMADLRTRPVAPDDAGRLN